MENTNSILYNYYKKYTYKYKGGISNFNSNENGYINNLSDEDAYNKLYKILHHVDELYPDFKNTLSKDYKDLKSYFKNNETGIKDTHDLISYSKSSDGTKGLIDFEGLYILVCIAYDSEYDRLKDRLTDTFWDTLKEFINETSCVPILKSKSDDQLWRKDELHRTYGINTMKLYLSFIFKRGIRSDIKELFNNNLRDIEIKCKTGQNGGIYAQKSRKYKYRYLQ